MSKKPWRPSLFRFVRRHLALIEITTLFYVQEFGGLTGVSKTKMLILHITGHNMLHPVCVILIHYTALHLLGPNCPDLDMVDLPGLVSTHVR